VAETEGKEESLEDRLKRQLDDVPWSGLREHAARDGIIILDQELDMVETAVALAEDRFHWVNEQIGAGKITKPSKPQLDLFEKSPEQLFRFLIVQPFVLIQALEN